MATKRKRGRPRKVPQNVIPLTEVTQTETPSLVGSNFSSGVSPVKVISVYEFTPEEIERIKSCDQVYLVTKNNAVLKDGKRDKQVHDCTWLKEKL